MITGSMVRLREKRITDALDDYTWQTDPELAKLDALPVLTLTFRQYISNYTAELLYASATKQQFAIETLNSKHIGNCTYYSIDEAKGEGELGIIIGDRDYWDKEYGTDAVNTLVNHVFRQTNLQRIHLKTLDWNIRAQKCFQKCGFTSCGESVKDGHKFVLMELHRSQWEKKQEE
ncbi:GNAT family N-acetyltransferase [Chloroflexota bacterium]